MTRFTFLPGLRRFRLQSGAVQIGTDPDRALLLELPDSRLLSLLDRLDGWIDEAAYFLTARKLGVPSQQADDLLALLRDSRLLVDPAVLASDHPDALARRSLSTEASALAMRRAEAPGEVMAARAGLRVFVGDAGPLAHGVAGLLRRSGVGRVWCADDGRRGQSTFTVLINNPQPPSLTARAHARRKLPYLSVSILDGTVHVGPLVEPGRTPCIYCVELHRRDAVPYWRNASSDASLLEATLFELAVTVITSQVLQHVDGRQVESRSATVRLCPPLEVKRQTWTAHPDCGCVVAGT